MILSYIETSLGMR